MPTKNPNQQKVMTLDRFHEMSGQLYDAAKNTSPEITMSDCEKHILFSYLISEKKSGPLYHKYREFMSNYPGIIGIGGEVEFMESITWQELFEDCITDVKP
jgi:hypothetical protein